MLPFLNHVQVFSCKISLVCRLKYSFSCFSSDFSFLLLSICSPLCRLYCFWSFSTLFMSSSNHRIDFIVILVIPSFPDAYSLCHLSDIRLYASSLASCPLVHLSMFFPRSFQELSPVSYKWDSSLMRFLQESLVSRIFLVCLKYSF